MVQDQLQKNERTNHAWADNNCPDQERGLAMFIIQQIDHCFGNSCMYVKRHPLTASAKKRSRFTSHDCLLATGSLGKEEE